MKLYSFVVAAIILWATDGDAQTAGAGPQPSQIKPAMLVWSIGTDSPNGPSHMVEVITRATFQGRPTWRVTHYSHDPAASETNEFDLYDVDTESLSPIRSVMHNPEFRLGLSFGGGGVTLRREGKPDDAVEHIQLTTPVMPEGPGTQLLVAALPLRPAYKFRYNVVDRWSGKGDTRVKAMTLSVLGRSKLTTPFGDQDVFEILMRPDDDSFRIVEFVRARPPHYAIRVEYVRGKQTLVSEVTAMAIQNADT